MSKGIQNFILPAAEKPKPKARKTKPKQEKKHIQVEEPQILIDPRDISISPVVNGTGIHILVKYLGQIVNTCTLPRNLFETWLKSNPSQRIIFISTQISIQDAQIKKMIISEVVNLINRIFARGR